MNDDARFFGAWRQVRPDTAPAHITVIFAPAGALTYIVAMHGEQRLSLRWRIEGETLVSIGEDGVESASHFRFASPSMLVLEREDGRYVYRRDS